MNTMPAAHRSWARQKPIAIARGLSPASQTTARRAQDVSYDQVDWNSKKIYEHRMFDSELLFFFRTIRNLAGNTVPDLASGSPPVQASPELRELVVKLSAEVADLRRRLDQLQRPAPKTDELPESPIIWAGRWIDAHGDAYAGRWVALTPEGLVGSGETLASMKEDLHARGLRLDGQFVTRIPGDAST